MMLLGCGFIVVAVVLAVVFWAFVRPIPPSEMMTAEMAQKVAESLTPAKTLEFWEYFKQGLDRRTSPSYERWVGIYHLGEGFCLVLALGGAAMVAAGVAAGSKQKRGGEGGDKETRRQGDRETGRQGDRETGYELPGQDDP
jgi:hypothetical protein